MKPLKYTQTIQIQAAIINIKPNLYPQLNILHSEYVYIYDGLFRTTHFSIANIYQTVTGTLFNYAK